MKSPTSDLRRFSSGRRVADLFDIAVWKFDVVLPALEGRSEQRITCYVKHAGRSDAFQALFARWPKATILGTGLPLTNVDVEVDLGFILDPGAVVPFHELAEFGGGKPSLWWGG